MERVNSSIKRELSNIISRELTNTNITGLITVNKVDTAPDFSNSKVYVSMIAVKNKKEAMLALKKAAGFMRTRLAHILQFRKMPKQKTNSGAKKRFSFTGTGKVKRNRAYHSHILTKKTKKQKRNLVHSAIVDNSNMKQVRDLLNLR